jgi:hypothetical protein
MLIIVLLDKYRLTRRCPIQDMVDLVTSDYSSGPRHEQYYTT